ncbi:TPA: hypothetical protein ACPTN2_000078 [Escherichia coli]|uniref:hypothetical protein n=1 Tax=Escherichia coli TaxID=562 RepID=UPI001D077D52|nr:hypothetical protein [Escherichia coli]MCB6862330.1 hypothetical protein [Escherichia coli]HCO8192446.1 hypothetical protein [Escherichia coli]
MKIIKESKINNPAEKDELINYYLDLLNSESSKLSRVEFDFLLSLINAEDFNSFRQNLNLFIKNRYNNNNETDIDENESYIQNKNNSKKLSSKIVNLEESLKSFKNKLDDSEYNNNYLILKNKELESIINEKEDKISSILTKVKQLEASNSELMSRVQQERIDEKIPTYVSNVKSELGSDDKHFVLMSIIWSICGVIFGIAAVSLSFYTLFLNIDFDDIKGAELFYIFTRGLIGISILSWLSYVCLSNSKKYTHESIRRKDRRHALMFGQVYLQIYGSTASKEDAILVFKDWNMSGDSAFSDQTEQPPNVLSFLSSSKEKVKNILPDKDV